MSDVASKLPDLPLNESETQKINDILRPAAWVSDIVINEYGHLMEKQGTCTFMLTHLYIYLSAANPESDQEMLALKQFKGVRLFPMSLSQSIDIAYSSHCHNASLGDLCRRSRIPRKTSKMICKKPDPCWSPSMQRTSIGFWHTLMLWSPTLLYMIATPVYNIRDIHIVSLQRWAGIFRFISSSYLSSQMF